jgi:very-short-patch-repair endonuclease
MIRATPPSPLDIALEASAQQHGVVDRRQLLAAGLSRGAIQRLVARGSLRPLFRGVYQVPGPAGRLAREMAAVLLCGPGAVISHFSAAVLHGLLPTRSTDQPINVMVAGRQPAARPGVRPRRVRAIPPGDVVIVDFVPTTTVARTIFDLASRLPTGELERMIARAEREDRSVRDALRALLSAHPRRAGNPALASIIRGDEPVPFIRSEAETLLLALIRDAELPMPRVNVRIRGFEVDCCWPRERLIVEVDGFAYHGIPTAFEGDRRRDAILTAAGFRVIRVTWTHLTTQSHAVIARIAQALVVR